MSNHEKHSTYFNLKEAFQEKHCPICTLSRKSVYRYLNNLLYESVNDPGVRVALRKSQGFCERHFWQLVEFNDGFGISLLTADLLETFGTQFNVKAKKSKPEICPACRTFAETEKMYIDIFLENLKDKFFLADYERSFGFCLPHFGEMFSKLHEPDLLEKLKAIQLDKIERLIAELKEFAQKQDYRFSKKPYGREKDAWVRAVEFLKGRKDLLREK